MGMGAGQSVVPVDVPGPCSAVPESKVISKDLASSGAPPESKPKKKICCACPDTKRLRDECIVMHGEDACTKWVEAHKKCLRAEGFNV